MNVSIHSDHFVNSVKKFFLFFLGFFAVLGLMFFAQPAAAGEIPVKIEGKVVFVSAKVNGEGPFTFVLDTGAMISVLTPAAAKKAGLKEKAGSPINPVASSVRTIAVGETELRNLPVQIFDPPQALSLRLDHGIDYSGILGYTFLTNFVTTIDYPKKTVRLDPPGRKANEAAGKEADLIVLQRVGDLLYAATYVNGKGPFVFLVDTGSAETILSPGLSAQVKMKTTSDRQWPGVLFGSVDTIAVGKTTVANVQVVVRKLPENQSHYDGIIGYSFLSGFSVTINYRDKSLILTPSVKKE